jgi:integrase
MSSPEIKSTAIPARKVPKRLKRTTKYFKQHFGGFYGWEKIRDILTHLQDKDARIIMLGLLKTGCRAMELPRLKRSQVDLEYSPTQIMIRGMYVEKQKEAIVLVDEKGDALMKNGKKMFRFEGKEGFRNFPFPKKEPMSDLFMEYVKTKKPDEILFNYNYDKIYHKICTIQMKPIPLGVSSARWNEFKGPWWCHRIRSERACQLIKEYRYDTIRLMKWFGWSSSQMPQVYADISPEDLMVDGDVVYR